MGFEFADLEGVKQSLPDKDLAEANVNLEVPKVSYQPDLAVDGVSFKLTAGGRIRGFNDPKDEKQQDPDGILGPKDGSNGDLELRPQVEFDNQAAWLKYRFSAGIEVGLELDHSPLKAALDASKSAIFADYHSHPREENARTAFLADVSRLRIATNLDDITKLEADDALSYQIRGKLGASLTLSWGDFFSTNLNGLTRLLGSGTLLALKTSFGAEVAFRATLEDDFLLVFSRPEAGKVRLAVKKTKSRQAEVSAGLNVEVGFENPQDLSAALNHIVNGLVGESVERIDEILAKATLSDLSAIEKAVAQRLAKLLGLGPALEFFEELQERWDNFKKQVTDAIEKIAQAKLKAAITYHYLRTKTESSLLQAVIRQQDLTVAHHQALIKADISPLLQSIRAWLESDPGRVQLENYLHQDKVESEQSLGFTLSLGSWKASNKDTLKKTRAVQTNIDGCQRISYVGVRFYDGQWGEDKVHHSVDFNAQMPGFSARKADPRAHEFEYGLHLRFKWDEKVLTEKELREYIDGAVIWGALSPQQIQPAVDKLRDYFANEAKAQVRVELKIDPEQFAALIPLAAAAVNRPDHRPVCRALAKAMPWWDLSIARTNADLRQVLYFGPWTYYFRHPEYSFRDYASAAEGFLDDYDIKDQEGEGNINTANNRTFAKLIHLNGYKPVDSDFSGIYDSWRSFGTGIRILDKAIRQRDILQRIETSFQEMAKFWNQTLHVRALGVFFLELAEGKPQLLEGMESTMTVSFPDDNEEFTFGSNMQV